MNVVFTIKGKDYAVGLREAKRILNNVYDQVTSICINKENIEIDRDERMSIIKQLHGELYV